jgi:hypothetical protein
MDSLRAEAALVLEMDRRVFPSFSSHRRSTDGGSAPTDGNGRSLALYPVAVVRQRGLSTRSSYFRPGRSRVLAWLGGMSALAAKRTVAATRLSDRFGSISDHCSAAICVAVAARTFTKSSPFLT